MSAQTMKAWRTHEFTTPSKALKYDDVPVPVPGPGEVLIKVQAVPFNVNDLERVAGGNIMAAPPLPFTPGMELVGVVTQCGDGVGYLQGKRVVAGAKNANGALAEYALAQASSTFEIPEDLPLPDAGGLFFPFHIAWLGLYDRADLKAGQSVLIHAGAGGFGVAAIQLAKLRGARVFCTVGHDAKKAICTELGAEAVWNYETEDYAQNVLDLTDGKGCDVVFDTVGEGLWDRSFHCLGYNGHFLMMGAAGPHKPAVDQKSLVPRKIALGNFKFCGVIFNYAFEPLAKMLKQGMGWNFALHQQGAATHKQLLEWLAEGKIRPVIGKTIRMDEVPRALDELAARDEETRKVHGRVVVVL